MRTRSNAIVVAAALVAASVVWFAPRVADAANCGGGTACQCGDVVTQNYTLNGTLDCTCGPGGTVNNCLRLESGITLSGSGTLRCPANSATCTTVAIRISRGPATVSGINILGNSTPSASGGGVNFTNGVYVSEGVTGTVTNVDVDGMGNYGVHVDAGSSVVMSGGSIADSDDEGIHVSGSTATLSDLSITDSGDEAIYILGNSSSASATVTNIQVDGFALVNSVATGVNVEIEGAGSPSASLTATNLTVVGTGPDCVTARDSTGLAGGSTISIDNRALRDASNNPIAGFNCTDWLKASNGSTIDFSADVAGVCCCRLDPSNPPTGITLHLTPVAGDPDACEPSCPGGCCPS